MANVVAVSRSPRHEFAKPTCDAIRLIARLGVEGDAHSGMMVQHLSRVRADPTQPNLRQVHLLHVELHEELALKGFPVLPGQMGENITTRGLDVLRLPVGTLLRLGTEAEVEVTGLRNPCVQLDAWQPGLMAAVLDRAADGTLIRKAGIMGLVRRGGVVRSGDRIIVTLPPLPHRALGPA